MYVYIYLSIIVSTSNRCWLNFGTCLKLPNYPGLCWKKILLPAWFDPWPQIRITCVITTWTNRFTYCIIKCLKYLHNIKLAGIVLHTHIESATSSSPPVNNFVRHITVEGIQDLESSFEKLFVLFELIIENGIDSRCWYRLFYRL